LTKKKKEERCIVLTALEISVCGQWSIAFGPEVSTSLQEHVVEEAAHFVEAERGRGAGQGSNIPDKVVPP
jgi:hypothetical protein